MRYNAAAVIVTLVGIFVGFLWSMTSVDDGCGPALVSWVSDEDAFFRGDGICGAASQSRAVTGVAIAFAAFVLGGIGNTMLREQKRPAPPTMGWGWDGRQWMPDSRVPAGMKRWWNAEIQGWEYEYVDAPQGRPPPPR